MGSVMIANTIYSILNGATATKRILKIESAPICITSPEVWDGIYGNDPNLFNVYYSAPNLTLMGWSGEWDETQGPTQLYSDFYDESEAPMGGTQFVDSEYGHSVSLKLSAEHIGKYLFLQTTAVRGGTTVTRRGIVTIHVQAEALYPEVNYNLSVFPQKIAQINTPIEKAIYYWTGGAIIPPTITTGEWYKNGIPTGETGNLFPNTNSNNPYARTTSEGDMVQWVEICTNGAGLSGISLDYDMCKTLVSDALPTLKEEMLAQVTNRISGLSGGSTHMNIFSAVNYKTGTFAFNANNWCKDLRHQLTAHYACMRFSPPNYTNFSARYGHFLITPRHILTCEHIGKIKDGRYVRFFSDDDRLIEARIKSYAVSSEILSGFDLQILLLDKDMASEGIPNIPILGMPDNYRSRFLLTSQGDEPLPILGLSQDGVNQPQNVFFNWGNPKSDYPEKHQRMLYISTPPGYYPGFNQFPPDYSGFQYAPYRGDSGSPAMILAYDKLFLIGILYFPIITSNTVVSESQRSAILALIRECDQRAVNQGILSEPTGLLPTIVDITEAESYIMNT